MIVQITDTTEVGKALQTYTRDFGSLCTHININKWSKHKPINFPKSDGLLDSDFEGCAADRVSGIYYGLKATTDAGNISEIHNVRFDYVGRPRGGENSPYRLGDFRGYDTEARCNLYGEFDDSKKVDVDKDMLQVNIFYDEFNTTGVDINKLVPQNNVLNDVGHCYPAIVIDNYIHALINVRTDTYTQLKNGGAWDRYFKLDIDQSNPDKRLPLYAAAVRKVSFCLVQKLVHADGSYDFKQWQNVTNLVDNTNCIAIPDSTGFDVEFIHRLPPIIPESATANIDYCRISFRNMMEPKKDYTIPVRVRETSSGIEQTYKVVQHSYEFPQIFIDIDCYWSDFYLYPSRGDVVTLSVVVDYNKMVSSKTFTLTIK